MLQSKQVKKVSRVEKKRYAINTGLNGLMPSTKHMAHTESFIYSYKANEKKGYSINMNWR